MDERERVQTDEAQGPPESDPRIAGEKHPVGRMIGIGLLASLGIAAVNFGPGVQAQAHQKNEWTSISQLDEGRAILARWLSAIELS